MASKQFGLNRGKSGILSIVHTITSVATTRVRVGTPRLGRRRSSGGPDQLSSRQTLNKCSYKFFKTLRKNADNYGSAPLVHPIVGQHLTPESATAPIEHRDYGGTDGGSGLARESQ